MAGVLIIIQDATNANVGPTNLKPYPTYRLPEHTPCPYAWDFPAAREKKLLLTSSNSRRAVDILEIGDLPPFKFQVREKRLVAFLGGNC
jgi:hypothetical protein